MAFIPMVGTDQLAKLRDGIITAGTVTYLSGFLVVASYSTWKGFGLTKVLDSQYIVAGLFPAVVLFVTLQLLWASKQVVDKLRVSILDSYTRGKLQLDSKRASRFRYWLLPLRATNVISEARLFKISRWVFFTAAGLSILPAVAGYTVENVTFGLSLVGLIAMSMLSVGLGIALINLVNDLKAEPASAITATRAFSIFYILPALALLAAALAAIALIYVREIFPRMPIEFGGAAPRCVVLTVKTNLFEGKDEAAAPRKLQLELPSDPYVFSDDSKHIWQIARDQVLAMRSCTPVQP